MFIIIYYTRLLYNKLTRQFVYSRLTFGKFIVNLSNSEYRTIILYGLNHRLTLVGRLWKVESDSTTVSSKYATPHQCTSITPPGTEQITFEPHDDHLSVKPLYWYLMLYIFDSPQFVIAEA